MRKTVVIVDSKPVSKQPTETNVQEDPFKDSAPTNTANKGEVVKAPSTDDSKKYSSSSSRDDSKPSSHRSSHK